MIGLKHLRKKYPNAIITDRNCRNELGDDPLPLPEPGKLDFHFGRRHSASPFR